MKAIILLGILGLSFIGPCDSAEEIIPSGTCVKVRYVDGICLEAVLRVEREQDKAFAEDWNGQEDVFYGVFPCGTDWQKLLDGPVYVELLNAPQEPSCVRCMATINYDGKKLYNVRLVDGC